MALVYSGVTRWAMWRPEGTEKNVGTGDLDAQR